eukprot:scaffold463_cov103-Isochrysis_galbana.AAC.6
MCPRTLSADRLRQCGTHERTAALAPGEAVPRVRSNREYTHDLDGRRPSPGTRRQRGAVRVPVHQVWSRTGDEGAAIRYQLSGKAGLGREVCAPGGRACTDVCSVEVPHTAHQCLDRCSHG